MSALCSANTLIDTFGQVQTNCNYSANAPYSACDVIGDPLLYDIQSATFSLSGGMATIMISLNTGAVKNVNNQLTLSPFDDAGVTLIPGDILFYNPNTPYDPANPSTAQNLQYGLALTDHGFFTPGGLYNVTGSVSLQNAQTALNDSTDYYRRDEDVLLAGIGTPVSIGTVSIAANPNGNGTTKADYVITATFPTTTAFLSLMSNGQIGLLFSSADCGNDVIEGAVGSSVVSPATSQAPEPAPAFMMLAGVVLLAGGRAWRKHTAR
jgi:hypothetical protein